MKAIIIAGGFGTRLRPLTYNTPKAMVPVANIPFILHQIELIASYGIKDIILNLHYLSMSVKSILEKERRPGIRLYYSIEEIPLGTAGAVKNAQEYFDEDPLLIFNGDILTDLNLKELLSFHKAKKAQATLTLTKVEDPTTYGLVITDKKKVVKEFIEKPSWERVTANTINAGIYVIEPRVFREVPFGIEYSFERELFPKLLKEGQPVYGFESDAYWIDIGSPQKYMQAHRAILQGEVTVKLRGKEQRKRVWMGAGSKTTKSTKIFSPAIVGKGCDLKADSKLNGFTVLGDHVSVGEGSILANSIVLSGTRIGKDANLSDCIIGFNCRIEDQVVISGGAVIADGTVIKKGSRIGIEFQTNSRR